MVFLFLLFSCAIAANVCNVVSFGAVGDGKTLSTAAIFAAFEHPGCDTVLIPSGVFLTGALNWTRSNANVHIFFFFFFFFFHSLFQLLIEGTLLASTNSSLFPPIPEVPSYPCDRDRCFPLRHNPLLLLFNVSNVQISGNGIIDGQGADWWARHNARKTTHGRPRLLQTMYCQDLVISNITLKDSPFWTTHIWNSQRVEVAFVKVSAPIDSPNTDGVDPDSSSDVHVHDCVIDEGDDCIAVKSGMNEAGIKFGVPCKNILIERTSCRG
jgi:polygalacturonase